MRVVQDKMHRRRNLVIRFLSVALIFSAITLPVNLNAKTYEAALNDYQQADFKGCVKNSRYAMKAKVSSLEKSKILKIMGICQFMIKNKSSAAIAFKNALKFNPNTEISSDEVLDSEVIGFFNDEKTKFLAAKKDKPASKPVGTYAQTAKKTTLQVNSNVSGKVSISGIYAGVTGSPIDADGGQNQISVSADGYRTRTLKVNVSANKENVVTVNLTKPKPKVRRQKPAPAVSSNDRRRSKRALPKADEGLFADEDSRPQVPERDLAREFQMETGTGGYAYPQAPAPAYPQPVYPAPVYTPPPVYSPPVAVPPVVEAPPPNYGDDSAIDDYNPPPRKKSRRRSKSRRSPRSENNFLITILPFGAGQFQNGDTTMGIIFGGAQVGALVFSYLRKSQYEEKATEAKATLAVIAKGETEGCQTKTEIYDCQVKFLNDVNTIIGPLYDQFKYGLYAAGGLWAAGVIEAMINEPKSSRSSYRRRRAFENNDESGFTEELAWSQYSKSKPYWDVDFNLDPNTHKPIYGLGVRLEY